VAVAYVLAARLGFSVAFVAEQVTTVWAPTGIALATLLLGGLRLWPAIWVGAFAANALTAAPLWTALLIATGNTLEAAAATAALRRVAGFDAAFRRVSDVLAFVGIAAVAATTLAATIGVATLCAAGVQPWAGFAALWLDWWLGDALGALVVAPALLATFGGALRTRRTWIEALAFVAGGMAVTHFLFGLRFGPDPNPLEYAVFPLVIAAAVRGGPSVTALTVLGAAAVTILNTLRGVGPFAGPEIHQSLILLQTFMGVLAGTGLLLAAAIAECRTSERRERDVAGALREAKVAAESANRLKDDFLATLSHELRTPLNVIVGYTRMLQTDAIAPEARPRALAIIERNAAAQTELVEELLDMSRITTGKIRLDPTPVPIAAVLQESIDGIRPAAEAKRIRLMVDVDPFAGVVVADPARLHQVFWNLLTNAVKFTQQGGRVTASIRRAGADVEVEVRDTGSGIAPDFLPFVFEPFRQGDVSLGRGHGGLGLGLAISKQLVELHGGTIRVSSDGEGGGASFVVRLPRVADEP
jgi:signal transduction histidine kinase